MDSKGVGFERRTLAQLDPRYRPIAQPHHTEGLVLERVTVDLQKMAVVEHRDPRGGKPQLEDLLTRFPGRYGLEVLDGRDGRRRRGGGATGAASTTGGGGGGVTGLRGVIRSPGAGGGSGTFTTARLLARVTLAVGAAAGFGLGAAGAAGAAGTADDAAPVEEPLVGPTFAVAPDVDVDVSEVDVEAAAGFSGLGGSFLAAALVC